MDKLSSVIFIAVLIFASGLAAQDTTATRKDPEKVRSEEKKKDHTFIDEDGDGYNDNAPDHDGDGIPNALDPDYQELKRQKEFIDLDGDGINDNLLRQQKRTQKQRIGPRQKSGPQNPAPREGHGEKKRQKKSGKK